MGLFDGYFDPEQFGEGGGLLGRLIALQQQQGLYQPALPQSLVPQVSETAVDWLGLPKYSQAPFDVQTAAQDVPGQYAAGLVPSRSNFPLSDSNQSDIQSAGITSDQSVYCRTMRNFCIRECEHTLYGTDAFGPHRACIRTCMHNAGCLDF